MDREGLEPPRPVKAPDLQSGTLANYALSIQIIFILVDLLLDNCFEVELGINRYISKRTYVSFDTTLEPLLVFGWKSKFLAVGLSVVVSSTTNWLI